MKPPPVRSASPGPRSSNGDPRCLFPRGASTSPLTLGHRHLPGTSLIAVGGEVDLATSGQLADYIDRIRRPGDHMVFDLTELSFLDCSGLRVLMSSARQAAADDAGVRLAGVRGTPARLLQIVRVHALLPVYNTVEQALATVLTIARTG
ncbi:anti-sigma B factor antagonist [Streptosporangium subroseum]|uniref:Anti-sigma factor antagonist n=1 Tax=Streptosporangium subroseum TaxID=106412 RepID=A0A239NN26_9ACTN|nr:STAS domain-containing protein [Streptosporangium subroseum]SNT55778.1 anti-sigma B factor antagonist [Streptosporangium subroseum]